MNAFLHSTTFHALLVVAASAAAAGVAAIINAISSGTIPLTGTYAIYGTLATALLTAVGVALRNWIEANQPPAPIVVPPAIPPAPHA